MINRSINSREEEGIFFTMKKNGASLMYAEINNLE